MAVLASLAVLTSSVPPIPLHAVAVARPRAASAPARATETLLLLQMNLCDSGMELRCYSFGKAITEAAANIHRYRPAIVTLQEVCHDDVYGAHGWGPLTRAMVDLYGDDGVTADFVPAADRRTGEGLRCVNNHLYGVAVLYHGSPGSLHYGWYASQDETSEIRAWTCVTVIPDLLTGCTTHLSTNGAVAVRQCRELMSTLDSSWVMPDVIVAGDFNLRSLPGKPQDIDQCTPAGYTRTSDGIVQQVFYTRGVQWLGGGYEPMRFTDHPALYEQFRLR